MNIPRIDQNLATIKAMHIQLENGYHVSESDYSQFLDAMIAVSKIHLQAQKEYNKTKEQ